MFKNVSVYVENPGIIICVSVEALRDCAKAISLLHAISDKFLLRECLTILVAHTQGHWIEACKLLADCVQRGWTIKLLFRKHLWLLVPTPLRTQTHFIQERRAGESTTSMFRHLVVCQARIVRVNELLSELRG